MPEEIVEAPEPKTEESVRYDVVPRIPGIPSDLPGDQTELQGIEAGKLGITTQIGFGEEERTLNSLDQPSISSFPPGQEPDEERPEQQLLSEFEQRISARQAAAGEMAKRGEPRLSREQLKKYSTQTLEDLAERPWEVDPAIIEQAREAIREAAGGALEAVGAFGAGALVGASEQVGKMREGDIMAATYPMLLNAMISSGAEQQQFAIREALGIRELGEPRRYSGRQVMRKIDENAGTNLDAIFKEGTVIGFIGEIVFSDPIGSATLSTALAKIGAKGLASVVTHSGEFARAAKSALKKSELIDEFTRLRSSRSAQRGAFELGLPGEKRIGGKPPTSIPALKKPEAFELVHTEKEARQIAEANKSISPKEYEESIRIEIEKPVPPEPEKLPLNPKPIGQVEDLLRPIEKPSSVPPEKPISIQKIGGKTPEEIPLGTQVERSIRQDVLRTRFEAAKDAHQPISPAYRKLARQASIVTEENALRSFLSRGPNATADSFARGIHQFIANKVEPTSRSILFAVENGFKSVRRIVAKASILDVQQKNALQDVIGKTKGSIAFYDNEVERIGRALERMPEDMRQRVLRISDGGIDLETAYNKFPAEYEAAVEIIVNEYDFGRLQVELGLLEQSQFEKWGGIHVRRFYQKHIDEVAADLESRIGRFGRPSIVRQSKEGLGGTKLRQDISPEARAAMGEHLDALQVVPRDLVTQGEAVAKASLQRAIASYPEFSRAADDAEAIAEKWILLDNDAKKWAGLAGRRLHPEVASEFDLDTGWIGYEPPLNAYLRSWKSMVTVWNPPTQGGNFLSNIFFADGAGYAVYSSPKAIVNFVKSAFDLTKNRRWTKLANLQGILGSNYQQAVIEAKSDIAKWIENIGKQPKGATEKLIRGALNLPRRAYRAGDDVWKVATFRWLVEHLGLSPDQAAKRILEGFQHYDRLPKWVRAAERPTTAVGQIGSLIVTPFMSFKVEQARIFKNLLTNPRGIWTLAKWSTFSSLGTLAVKELGLASDEDLKDLATRASKYYERFGHIFPGSRLVTPWITKKGFLSFDLDRINPFAQMAENISLLFGSAKSISKGASDQALKDFTTFLSEEGIGQHPVLNAGIKIFSGTDPYLDRKLAPDDAKKVEKIVYTTESVLGDLAHPLIPGIGRSAKRLSAAWREEPVSGQRKPRNMFEEAVSLFGVNVDVVTKEDLKEYRRIPTKEQWEDFEIALDAMYERDPTINRSQVYGKTKLQWERYEFLGRLKSARRKGDEKAEREMVLRAVLVGPYGGQTVDDVYKALDNYDRPTMERMFAALGENRILEMLSLQLLQDPDNIVAAQNAVAKPLWRLGRK